MPSSLTTRVIFFALCLVFPCASFADYVLESATLGPTGVPGSLGGYTVSSFQFVGARFQVDHLTQVDHIGGLLGNFNFGDDNQVFGAIVTIGAGGDGFPASSPASFLPLAETTFGLSYFTTDISVPLSATLPAGDYALIFGSGRFGATATASLPDTNTDTAQASYFFGNIETIGSPGFWNDDPTVHDLRFTVNGATVPEPSTLALASFGLAGLAVWRLRLRKR